MPPLAPLLGSSNPALPPALILWLESCATSQNTHFPRTHTYRPTPASPRAPAWPEPPHRGPSLPHSLLLLPLRAALSTAEERTPPQAQDVQREVWAVWALGGYGAVSGQSRGCLPTGLLGPPSVFWSHTDTRHEGM